MSVSPDRVARDIIKAVSAGWKQESSEWYLLVHALHESEIILRQEFCENPANLELEMTVGQIRDLILEAMPVKESNIEWQTTWWSGWFDFDHSMRLVGGYDTACIPILESLRAHPSVRSVYLW
ncbi:MAG: hypothetical protein AAB074_03300 [Planctomycetota bacterium]